jgi:lipid A 3-O-deacylase
MYVRLALGFAVALSLPAARATAQEHLVSEVIGGPLIHDTGLIGNRAENGLDANLEVRFVSPSLLAILGSPRPHLGVSINTLGHTSQLYAGLTYLRGLLRGDDALYVEATLGGAVHDGDLHTTNPLGHKQLGTRFLFRESVELGYAITPRYTLSIMFDHVSNAGLSRHNGGMENAGIRIGYSF